MKHLSNKARKSSPTPTISKHVPSDLLAQIKTGAVKRGCQGDDGK